jgi:Glycosyltransferase family 29 (sialyltransferase).
MGSFKEFVTGKRIVIVGPAATLKGSGYGSLIDSHDIVVRLNHAWPLPKEFAEDIGTRIDVIYHNLNPLNQRILPKHVAQMKKDGVKWIVSSHPANRLKYRRRHRRFRRANKGRLRFRAIPAWLKRRLKRKVGFPNSGVVAIADLLRFPIESLYVTGFSFYTTGYLKYPNYKRITKRMALRNHNQSRHKTYLAQLLKRESRLRVDPFIEAILNEHMARRQSRKKRKR